MQKESKKKVIMKRGVKGGYMGKILRIDLSNRKTWEEDLPGNDVLRKYVGCWGLGVRYLYDLLPPGYTASDPENPLVFMTAPLTGVHLPGATNTTLATKNFNTRFTVGRSHSHGKFGIYTKANGYDGFIITGASDEPVYLWIHDGKAEIRDARHLWGKKDTHETEELLQEELGGNGNKPCVASIGPAGENLVSGAMLMNDRNHGFMHCGVGSVLGSKKLKAIAIFGEKPVPVADPEKLGILNKEWISTFRNTPAHVGWNISRNAGSKRNEYRGMLKTFGLAGMNFRKNQFVEHGIGWSQFNMTSRPCPRCPIGCAYDCEITTRPYKGYVATVSGGGEGMEGAGSILGMKEPGAPYYILDHYDRYGIEASVAGCTIATVLEAYEKGLITSKDLDGLEPKWGDVNSALTLLKKMVYREGIGEILASGIKGTAEFIGGEALKFGAHIKGTGINLHDWRASWCIMVGQIVGSGASHIGLGADRLCREPDAGYPDFADPFDKRNKPLEVKNTNILKFMNDCSGLCWLCTCSTPGVLRMTAESLNAVTGWDYTAKEMWDIGERVMQMERAFNVRHGLKPADDWTVPERLVEAPDDGPAKGICLKDHLEWMVKEYHRLMEWDEFTGKPLRSALKRLGLDDVTKDLWG